MELTQFVRIPFFVEAVEITEENIEELAPHIGTVKTKEDGSRFILVDQKKVPNIYKVYVGFWMTKMKENIRCYSPKTFADQFRANTPEIQAWVDFLNKPFNEVETASIEVEEIADDQVELPQAETGADQSRGGLEVLVSSDDDAASVGSGASGEVPVDEGGHPIDVV